MMKLRTRDSEIPKLSVSISTGDVGGQITLFNGYFDEIAVGVCSLDIDLEPGLYKAGLKVGDRFDDLLFEVSDAPLRIDGNRLYFSSPLPIEDTSSNHEYQHEPALELLGGSPQVRLGQGAELVLFVRDCRQAGGQSPAERQPWQDVRIRWPYGKEPS